MAEQDDAEFGVFDRALLTLLQVTAALRISVERALLSFTSPPPPLSSPSPAISLFFTQRSASQATSHKNRGCLVATWYRYRVARRIIGNMTSRWNGPLLSQYGLGASVVRNVLAAERIRGEFVAVERIRGSSNNPWQLKGRGWSEAVDETKWSARTQVPAFSRCSSRAAGTGSITWSSSTRTELPTALPLV